MKRLTLLLATAGLAVGATPAEAKSVSPTRAVAAAHSEWPRAEVLWCTPKHNGDVCGLRWPLVIDRVSPPTASATGALWMIAWVSQTHGKTSAVAAQWWITISFSTEASS